MKKLFLAAAIALAPLTAGAATVTLDAVAPGNVGLLVKDETKTGQDQYSLYRTDPVGPNKGSAIQYLSLDAGTYVIKADENSWSRWKDSRDCTDGANCITGYEFSFAFFMVDTATIGSEDGRVTTVRDGVIDNSVSNLVNFSDAYTNNFFEFPEMSFDDVAGTVMAKFTLGSAQDVGFYLHDNNLRDNRGSVTISISAVPLPAGLPLLGLGLAGIALIRRKKA